jgi:hypothetical protein
MLDYPCAYYSEINVNQALSQMLACFYRRRMIPVFPEGPVPVLFLVEFLPCSPRDQLNRFRDDLSAAIVPDEEMDVVGGNHIIEHTQAIAFLCLKKPLKVPATAAGKFQKKSLLMTPMRNVPDITREVMPVCSRHTNSFPKEAFSRPQMPL